MNRATAESSQDTAATEGLAPLMLWVKRLADHVTQDLLGQPDLEFAWGDLTPADPAAQAKIIDTYVRDGVYAVNEARGLLGLDPVPGGDQPMIYGTQGAVPLGAQASPVTKQSAIAPFDKAGFNPAEPRLPLGVTGGGQWTDGTSGAIKPAQELIPFGARPPFVFEEPPEEVTRPFKQRIPNQSGKEASDDVPSWAQGKRPYVGENGRSWAQRTMDDRYGRGNWERNQDRQREYNQLKKFGDRAFRDPRSILLPEDDQI